MITYKRNDDGTFTKTGEFAFAPKEVQLWIVDGERPTAKPFGSYTLAKATEILEDGITKKQLKFAEYRIVPVIESDGTVRAEDAPKAPRAKAVRVSKSVTQVEDETPVEGEPAAKKSRSKLDGTKIAELYTGGMKEVDIARQLGYSPMGVRTNLIKQGLFKPRAK